MENSLDVHRKKRFLSLNDEERNILLDSAIPKNTKNATKNWISTLNGYLKTKQIANNVDEILDSACLRYLKSFILRLQRIIRRKRWMVRRMSSQKDTVIQVCEQCEQQ